jgi:BirA family biotin operon repressor/biotin-[acetyl-CoA-carboxylase] ligase
LHKSADAVVQLPLMVAVAVARALQRAGVAGAGIKWPNDILVDGKKLAGILLESHQDGTGALLVVVGVGVNVRMPPGAFNRNPVEYAWTDAGSHVPGPLGEDFRDRLCGLLLDEFLRSLVLFEARGFAPFAAAWAHWDILRGRAVDISISGQSVHETVSGTAAGLSDRGGLLVQCAGPPGKDTAREFLAADVSVRLL